MKGILLGLLLVSSAGFSLPIPLTNSNNILLDQEPNLLKEIYVTLGLVQPEQTSISIKAISALLKRQPGINPTLISKLISSLRCSDLFNIKHNNILTLIDYSLPSNEKRLWVFDLKQQKLLFNTYVSHGIKSGALLTQFFSNKYNSKSSSMGLYSTNKSYYGREGISLRLDGLDRGFNDNASNRSIVMHGGWYMSEPFIKRYGRPGRSWGCPAIPLDQAKNLINTIKNQSLFFVYYPDNEWFNKSKYFHCQIPDQTVLASAIPAKEIEPIREKVLFAHVKTHLRSESDPVLVISADNYERFFKIKAPLNRMLRRQIENAEYIALSPQELSRLSDPNYAASAEIKQELFFVVPIIKMVRGYYETEMHKVDIGKIKDIKITLSPQPAYTIIFENKPALNLHTSDIFVRWLGL